MEILESRVRGVLVVAPVDRLDAVGAPELSERLLDRISAGEPRIVLDLSRLVYISSGGLRALARAGRELRAARGRLDLAGAAGAVKEVLELSGFSGAFPMFASAEDAVTGA